MKLEYHSKKNKGVLTNGQRSLVMIAIIVGAMAGLLGTAFNFWPFDRGIEGLLVAFLVGIFIFFRRLSDITALNFGLFFLGILLVVLGLVGNGLIGFFGLIFGLLLVLASMRVMTAIDRTGWSYKR